MVEFKEIASREELDKELKNAGDKTVLLKFQGEWCGPCKLYKESLKNLPDEYDDKILVLEADVDKCEKLTDEFGIRSIPTTYVFINSEQAGRFVGNRTSEQVIEEIKNLTE